MGDQSWNDGRAARGREVVGSTIRQFYRLHDYEMKDIDLIGKLCHVLE